MADLATDGAHVTWEAPECPFSIEYSTRVLDDIRLAVVDAFFSLPRGGAEIGGILLGTHAPGRIAISSYQAIECEHGTGPSFTLSKNDEAKLTDLLASVRGQVVGWYHSHTRSAIFLSAADLDIHSRFFPEPCQIAIVMKPHAFQPIRMGFFFRERDGSLRAGAPYREMLLEPLPMRQVPSGEHRFQPSPAAPYRRETENRGVGPIIDVVVPREEPVPAPPGRPVPVQAPEPQITVPERQVHAPERQVQAPEPPPVVGTGLWSRAAMRLQASKASESPPVVVAVPAPIPPAAVLPAAVAPSVEPEPERLQPAPPSFLVTQPEPSWRWRSILAIGVGLALGAAGYQTHELWLPRLMATVQSVAPPGAPPAVGLNTLDSEGQLQIRWDRNSFPARTGVSGILEIADGAQPRPQSIPMDTQHIQSGVFTYGRQSEKVEVKLTIRMPDGRDVREVTTFLGALPQRQPPSEDGEVRRQRDELAVQAAKLKSDLAAQEKRAKNLERSLGDARKTIKDRQLKRLQNQAPPK